MEEDELNQSRENEVENEDEASNIEGRNNKKTMTTMTKAKISRWKKMSLTREGRMK